MPAPWRSKLGLLVVGLGTIAAPLDTAVNIAFPSITHAFALEVEDIRFVLVQDCIHSSEFYRDAHFVLLNYTCRCAGPPEVRLNEEALEFQWAPPEQALRLRLNEPTRILLEAVRAGQPEAALAVRGKNG